MVKPVVWSMVSARPANVLRLDGNKPATNHQNTITGISCTLLESHAVRLFLHLWSWLVQLFFWWLTVQLSVFLHSANTECTNVTWTKCSCCLLHWALLTYSNWFDFYIFIYLFCVQNGLMYRPNFCNYDIPPIVFFFIRLPLICGWEL